jgi:hypothetical protein
MGNDVAPSFTSRLLQEAVAPGDEEILKWAATSMYLNMISKYASQDRSHSTFVEPGSMYSSSGGCETVSWIFVYKRIALKRTHRRQTMATLWPVPVA